MVVPFLVIFIPVIRTFTWDVGDPGSVPPLPDMESGFELRAPTLQENALGP